MIDLRSTFVSKVVVYMDDRMGLLDVKEDAAYVMDDFGFLVRVPFTLPSWFWQEC